MSILNVYAPNEPSANEAFWDSIERRWYDLDLPAPDLMLGDFNIVEDSLDRLPNRTDHAGATGALGRLRAKMLLQDGWRATNPQAHGYTFPRFGVGSQSRLDRIYCSDNILATAQDWDISPAIAIPSDHKLASVRITDLATPYIGPGRWTLPLFLLQDQQFLSAATQHTTRLLSDLTACPQHTRSEADNPQQLFAQYKGRIIHTARHLARKKVPLIMRDIAALKVQLDLLIAAPNFPTDTDSQLHAALLQQRITQLETRRFENARTTARARWQVDGNAPTKYWSQISKNKRPRDLIYRLQSPDMGPSFVTKSKDMAALARDYHNALQTADCPPMDDTRAAVTQEVLGFLNTRASLDDTQQLRLEADISYDDVLDSLRIAANGKAAGIDGLPYEFWKTLHNRYRAPTASSPEKGVNVALALHSVFSDVSAHGVLAGTGFAKGWLCPLYKKHDRANIANYRPITLLNTDYKLYTKLLALKLARIAPKLIHPDQAGFVPGRRIYDQVKLAKLMIDYAEATEECGVIVALDQEKAYDRIDHAYLWRTLNAFGLPTSFIAAVQSLYSSAETVVIINGEISSPFQVTRGVRQGDPLSCLLFDLAIKPLAASLRQSTLAGFLLPGRDKRLITTLFADDTTVYLSSNDDFDVLDGILARWCSASTAKFNVTKTVAIPIGPPPYHDQVLRAHAHPLAPSVVIRVPSSASVAPDGIATRILGARIGNNVDETAGTWLPLLDDIRQDLLRWGRCHPSYNGKRHIIQMVIGGRTQYLT